MRSYLTQVVVVLIIALVASIAAPSPLSAQELRGSLLVNVVDSSGGAIPVAQITLAAEKVAAHRQQTTDARGEAHFAALSPATYSVEVAAKGFASQTQRIVVSISAQSATRFVLAPEALRQSVEVRDHGPSLASNPLDTASSSIQTVITSDDLDEVPLSARSFANIALMAPFTAPVEPSDPTKARITAVSFGGSSGLNIDFSVDGGDNNDDFIGGFLQNYSPEAMQEFVVRSAQFGSETSRSNGGSIILSTRRGSNDWHGSASYYYRGQDLNARNPLDNPEPDPKQPFSRQNGVATFGGPLRRIHPCRKRDQRQGQYRENDRHHGNNGMRDEVRQRKPERPGVMRLHLNNSTVANGSADHGRKRLMVNFVGCPGVTSTCK